MARYPDNTPQQLKTIAYELENNPRAERTDKLLALAIEQKLGLVDSHALFETAQKLFDVNNSQDLLELGRWLNQQGLSSYTLELIPEKEALKRRDVFLVWVDALALNHQWARLKQVMTLPDIPIEDFVSKVFLARIDLELGDTQRAQNDWNLALIAVAYKSEELWFMANYAQELGLTDWQRQVLLRLVKIPQSSRSAYEALVRLDQRMGNVYMLHADLTAMYKLFDDDAAVANDWAYTGLLI
ncbi:MAG TPA: hypothetical protein PLV25_03025, partial [Opitutales bacterium]|nr:hypothetical protein [Opitutales bacterium]